MPADAHRIASGVDLVEDDVHGGAVFLEGIAAWCWSAGDEAGRRLAMVGLVDAGAARHGEVAAGFGCAEVTLWRHRKAYAAGGAAALTPAPRGPRRASRLTPERLARIRRLRQRGVGLATIAEREGVARSTVIRALAAGRSAADAGGAGRDGAAQDPPQTQDVGRDQLDVADGGNGADSEDNDLDLEDVEGGEDQLDGGNGADSEDNALDLEDVEGGEDHLDGEDGGVVEQHGEDHLDVEDEEGVEGGMVVEGGGDVEDRRAAENREHHEDGGHHEVGGVGVGLVALARPRPRTAERGAARAGLLVEAPPVITQGAGLPLAGALTLLPALAVGGLLEVAAEVYQPRRAGFYGLRALLLTMAFAAAVGEPRAEGLCRIDPADLGRLLGLDRAPEPKTLRRRLGELAAAGRCGQLLAGLARRHVAANQQACGIFYVDGHVRAYHGKADVPKHHLARMRLAMPAEEDVWLGDARGDGLLCWQAPAGSSLVSELRRVADQVRDLVGPQARPTVCFDRGGWSPKLFSWLDQAGFDVLTYRKGDKTPEPDEAFTDHALTDDRGVEHRYQLADRRVELTYGQRGREQRFACRQITRRSPNGHQTQILTTRDDADAAAVAHLMFSRWRQENFFRYLRARYALDALDAYATVTDDPERSVPNPARKDLARQAARLEAAIDHAQACHDRHTAAGVPAHARPAHDGLGAEITHARTHLATQQADADAAPARLPLRQVRPEARRLDPERKRICDAVRMAVYNAESALARLLAAHYPRARHEARTLLREIFTRPADLHIAGGRLHVRVHPLSAPRRTRALTGLCADLTATQTRYPGTHLTLVYNVKSP